MERILHISTHDYGGAAIAAKRQCQALRSAGCDSTFMAIRVGRGQEFCEDERDGTLLLTVPERIWHYHEEITSRYYRSNRTEASNTWFSAWPTETGLDQALVRIFARYDVLHFHWTAGLLSSRLVEMVRTLGKRIVISSHDMNYFTGGCHYNAGCRAFEHGCAQCPQVASDPMNFVACGYTEKMRALASLDATWVFPSQWLAREFRASRLGGADMAVFPTCVDTDRFLPASPALRRLRRRDQGFDERDIIIVAGAQDNGEKRKGFSHLAHAVAQLGQRPLHTTVKVVTFGGGKPALAESPQVRHLHLGAISQQAVADLFQVADLLMFPSTEENFSNLILESLLSGCPVLAFRVGGVPDIVEHNVNGYVVDEVGPRGYAAALTDLVAEGRLRALTDSTFRWSKRHGQRVRLQSNVPALLEVYQQARRASHVPVQFKDAPGQAFYRSLFRLPEELGYAAAFDVVRRLEDYLVRHRASCGEPAGMGGRRIAVFPVETAAYRYESELGPFRWTGRRRRLFFASERARHHGLLFQLPAAERSAAAFALVHDHLRVRVNGDPAVLTVAWGEPGACYVYAGLALDPGSVAPPGCGNVVDIELVDDSETAADEETGFMCTSVVAFASDLPLSEETLGLLGLRAARADAGSAPDHDVLARAAADYLNNRRWVTA